MNELTVINPPTFSVILPGTSPFFRILIIRGQDIEFQCIGVFIYNPLIK